MAALSHVSLRKVHGSIRDGDLLLYRRPRSVIAITGSGIHSHAAWAAWWDDELMCLEVREWAGGRAVTLASQVRRYPARIDVYRPDAFRNWPVFDRAAATRYMRGFAGCDYGYWNILRASLLRLIGLRLFVKPDLDDEARDGHPPFCSQACVMATRIGGGVDPVRNMADRLVSPTDLAKSPFYEPVFTKLVP